MRKSVVKMSHFPYIFDNFTLKFGTLLPLNGLFKQMHFLCGMASLQVPSLRVCSEMHWSMVTYHVVLIRICDTGVELDDNLKICLLDYPAWIYSGTPWL